MRYLLALAAFAMFAATAPPARAERLVSVLSNETVQITSSFAGETLSLFGAVEPDAGQEGPVAGPLDVIVVIIGPTTPRVARRKTNVLGIWVNTEQVVFEDFPSYYRVLSSRRLADIASPALLAAEDIAPEAQPRYSPEAGWWNSVVFGRELVRLMTEKGVFGVNETGVGFVSNAVYTARVSLPSDTPPGPYIARTFVFRNGEIIARTSEGFAVRKIGFERFLGRAATQFPLLYGMVCVALAIGIGWLGGVVFRR